MGDKEFDKELFVKLYIVLMFTLYSTFCLQLWGNICEYPPPMSSSTKNQTNLI
jgi:hypothetical protein